MLAVFLVCAILSVNAQNTFSVSSAEVSFTFVSHDVEGTITGFNSSSSIDMDTIENSTFKGSVNVSTISTGNSIRNWSLRRGKYFDADKYPKITFESSSVKQDGEDIEVLGQLTIKDVTKDIRFLIEKNDSVLIGKTTIYSSDYGIAIKNEREKNKVLVTIKLSLK